jgi:hypothetical protein
MSKFKIGDTVRCVVNGTAFKPKANGYKPDKEFVVDFIRWDLDGGIYFPKDGNGVFECDLILVKSLHKTLPKSFACKNTNQELWDKYISWLNTTYNNKQNGTNKFYLYYGIDKYGETGCFCSKVNFDTILTLEEWDEIVNGTQIKTEEVMTKYTITRIQLKEIHEVACDSWKSKIQTYTLRNPFGNTFEFTQAEVNEMFKAATTNQKPVLEGIFGKQTREIDLSTGHVDGKVLFDTNRNLLSALMCVRTGGTYGNKAFILDETYNWDLVRDTNGNLCLVPTRK